ncbi:hypothetical protein ACFSMW_02215 [Virgibacillus halophilus]|uniref:Uncharacterized protein n=1 Tax=Tigheibacillus halophilus TaxID=361280 RepID=A0ABU5C9T2_9BACI|nr:hypothetical protein [Virgibacillus halophilus]
MSEQDQEKKEVHVDKLTIYADQIFLEGSRVHRGDSFFFGSRKKEEAAEIEDDTNQPIRRRYNPFLNDAVFRPKPFREAELKESGSTEELNDQNQVMDAGNGQAEPHRPFWLR